MACTRINNKTDKEKKQAKMSSETRRKWIDAVENQILEKELATEKNGGSAILLVAIFVLGILEAFFVLYVPLRQKSRKINDRPSLMGTVIFYFFFAALAAYFFLKMVLRSRKIFRTTKSAAKTHRHIMHLPRLWGATPTSRKRGKPNRMAQGW